MPRLRESQSLEHLEELMLLARRPSWWALGGALLCLLVLLAWSFWALLPLKVGGQAILLRQGGLTEVVSPSSGQLLKLHVKRGDVVSKGDRVATFQSASAPNKRPSMTQARRSGIPIRSMARGRVIEVLATPGDMLTPGTPLLMMESTKPGRLKALVFVSAWKGSRLKPGMKVQLLPTMVRREQFGFLLGKVLTVSPYPVSPKSLRARLRHEGLVQTLTQKSAPIAVEVELQRPQASRKGQASKYRWSNPPGPKWRLQGGTLCQAWIIYNTHTPFEILFSH